MVDAHVRAAVGDSSAWKTLSRLRPHATSETQVPSSPSGWLAAVTAVLETDLHDVNDAAREVEDLILRCVAAAHVLAHEDAMDDHATAALIGLTALLGELVVAAARPVDMERLLAQPEPFLASVQEKVLGVDCAELSAELAELWGMDAAVVNALRGRNSPTSATALGPLARRAVLLAHVAARGSKSADAELAAVGLPCGMAKSLVGRMADMMPTLADQDGRPPLRVVSAARVAAARHRLPADDARRILGSQTDAARHGDTWIEQLPRGDVMLRFADLLEDIVADARGVYGEVPEIGAILIDIEGELDDGLSRSVQSALARCLAGRTRAHEILGVLDPRTMVLIAAATTPAELAGAMRRLATQVTGLAVEGSDEPFLPDLSLRSVFGEISAALRSTPPRQAHVSW